MSRRRETSREHRHLPYAPPETVCGVCKKPSPDQVLVCSACMDVFHGQVARLQGLFDDLAVEYLRRSRKTSATLGFEQPLLYGAAAAELLAEGRRMLAGYCLALERYGAEEPPGRNAPIAAFQAVLTRHERSLPTSALGVEIVAGLDDFNDRAARLCDLPPEKRYVGLCVCGERLMASGAVVTCSCGQAWDAEIRQAQLELDLRDTLLTLAEVEAATAGRVKAKTVQKWIERGRIRRNKRGRVRFGDVLGCEMPRA